MTFQVQFFLSDRLAGTVQLALHSCGSAAWPVSIAWYCWRCSKVWARMVTQGAEREWEFKRSLCEQCPYERWVGAWRSDLYPGCLIDDSNEGRDILAALPLALLQREARFQLQHFDVMNQIRQEIAA